MFRLSIFLLTIIGTYSCSDCTNCTPFTTEPYMNLHFLSAADTSNKVVIIDSINHESVSGSRYYMDTTFFYNLPLDMNLDQSQVLLSFRDTTDMNTSLSGVIDIIYDRQFEKRQDNYLVVDCFVTSIESNFPIFGFSCSDSTYENCKSNYVTAQIYL